MNWKSHQGKAENVSYHDKRYVIRFPSLSGKPQTAEIQGDEREGLAFPVIIYGIFSSGGTAKVSRTYGWKV